MDKAPELQNTAEAGIDVLAELRAATSSRHAILDREMPLSKAFPTLLDYRDHLLVLKAWLEPLEQWLAQFDDGPQDPKYGLQLHTVQINADLAHASISQCSTPTQDAETPAPRVAAIDFPAIATPAYRWGVCYVIEGSQLGGAVLQRRLAKQLAPHPLTYLGTDATSPGPAWKNFVASLRAGVQGKAACAEACLGACDAFDRILAVHQF
jgi:heme oxygenase